MESIHEHRNSSFQFPMEEERNRRQTRGEEEVVKNSSLITSPPFIHISREDFSLSLARGEGRGEAREDGGGKHREGWRSQRL